MLNAAVAAADQLSTKAAQATLAPQSRNSVRVTLRRSGSIKGDQPWGASLPLCSVTDMPRQEEITMGARQVSPQPPSTPYDPQEGAMPDVAGHPTLDASTGAASR